MTNEFSVFWTDPEGTTHKESDWLGAREAVELAHSLATRPAARMGIIKRIIITDAEDFTCFLWQDGEVVYPPKDATVLHEMAARHDH